MLKRKVQHLLIGDRWQATADGRNFETHDRFTGKVLARIARGIAKDVDRAVRAATVWINTYGLMDPAVPMGGVKQSGYGREYGTEHLNKFLQTKSIWINADP